MLNFQRLYFHATEAAIGQSDDRLADRWSSPIFSASTINRAIITMMTVEEFNLDSAAIYDQWKAEQEAEWFGVREQIEAKWAASAPLTKPMFEVLSARDTNGRWVWALLEIA